MQNIVFGLVGGLAIFIYGISLMGEGLQKVAGDKMRRVLELLTTNPIIAIIVGAVVTMIMQSSSAVTVIVIGFISAGLLTLPQAIGVIMGANIGTTITTQIVTFKLGEFAYPIAAIGFVLFFFTKRNSIKNIGQTIFAFGILFVGLNIMSDVMKPLADYPSFKDALLSIGENPGLGLLVGTVLTVIVQSSSVVTSVLAKLAGQSSDGVPLISLQAAIPILIGSNIGTTITAILASIGANINAKRAALAHTIFNVSGALIFVWFIPVFTTLIEFISSNKIDRQVANAHTLFNILNTIIWVPFIWLIVKFITSVLKGKDDITERRVLYIDYKVLNSPAIAMELAIKELARMAKISQIMMAGSKNAFVEGNVKEADSVDKYEGLVDDLQCEIVKYLSVMLSQHILTEKQSVRLSGLMHVTHDIERIGDNCQNISDFARDKIRRKLVFSDAALSEISDTFEKVNEMVDNTIQSLYKGDTKLAQRVLTEEYEIDNLESRLRANHIDRLNKGLCNPESAITFIELIHNLERIADNCKNIAEAVLIDYNAQTEEISG